MILLYDFDSFYDFTLILTLSMTLLFDFDSFYDFTLWFYSMILTLSIILIL